MASLPPHAVLINKTLSSRPKFQIINEESYGGVGVFNAIRIGNWDEDPVEVL